MHLLNFLCLFRPYNALQFCASVPSSVSSSYSTWAWKLKCGHAPCVPVILSPPHCPALPEGLKKVLYSFRVCLLKDQDGLNSGLADFWREALAVPVLTSCRPYIILVTGKAILLSRNTNKMQLCNRIYYSKVFWRLNMFRAAQCSSSGALNCICSLWFICPYGDQLLPWQWSVTMWAYKPEAANTV
jgi:hypothetical protein